MSTMPMTGTMQAVAGAIQQAGNPQIIAGGYPAGATVVRPMQVVGQAPGQIMYTSIPNPASPKIVTAPAVMAGGMVQTVTSPTAMGATVIRGQQIGGQQILSPAAARVASGSTVMTMAGAQPTTTVIRQAAPGATSLTTQPGVLTQAPMQLGGSVVRMAAPGTTVRAAPMVAGAQVRPHTLAGPSYTQGAYEQKHQNDDPQLQNLKELRKTSGLKHVPVGDGLEFLKATAVEGKLTREQFVLGYVGLLSSHGIQVPSEHVQHAVFDLFDRDDNNVVDMMELICGISLLCAGSEDDKIHAVFNVFDENGDGFISMDEMLKFLTSVFKVVLTPNVIGVMNSMGVQVDSPEDLASVTVLECFKTADLNHDGKLSVSEFKNWFYAPRNDPSFLFSPVRKLLQ